MIGVYNAELTGGGQMSNVYRMQSSNSCTSLSLWLIGIGPWKIWRTLLSLAREDICEDILS